MCFVDEEAPLDDGDDIKFLKLTPEEKLAKKTRQLAVSAFQRAVTMMAFTHLSSDDDKLFDELLKVLSTPPLERTEWELQRLLLWAENVKTGNPQNGFPFILGLPGQEESDVRIEVCRCMTLQRVDANEVSHPLRVGALPSRPFTDRHDPTTRCVISFAKSRLTRPLLSRPESECMVVHLGRRGR
eukprot:COSAG02_NODE_8673_length_2485_cov_2.074602_2_plen_185_part_00